MGVERWAIQGKNPGPRGLILAGVHGDEYEPIAAVRQLYFQLKSELSAGELTLVPIVNQPAFSCQSRVGEDGLDLARTFPGDLAGSPTEKIAAEVASWIESADFLIDLHTGGRVMQILPLTGYVLHADPSVLQTQRGMAEAFNLPVIWGTTPSLQGRSLSVARDAGVPAIYAEWGGGEACQRVGVDDYVQGCLNVLSFFKMIPERKISSRLKYRVEDAREESGHLQKNFPAPVAGFYEPVAELGESVFEGDLIGKIWSGLDEQEVEIVADQSGVLLLQRVLPAVKAGECLATILELDSTTVESEVEDRDSVRGEAV